MPSTVSERRLLLEAELKKIQEDRKKTFHDRDREGRLKKELDRISSSVQRHEIHRRLAMSPTSSPRHASHARRKAGHRRQLSDPKLISALSPLKDDAFKTDIERSLYGHSTRTSALNAFNEDDSLASRLLGGTRMHGRRGSEGGLEGRSYSSIGLYDTTSSRQKAARKIRKPRSWHPSPYASDDDDDMFSREEKKQKIKAEISRRRQQIEENSRLHEELLRLARLRETAELGFTDHRALAAYDQNSPQTTAMRDSTSVLRSIDEILRDARDPNSLYYGNYTGYRTGNSPTNRYGIHAGGTRISPRHIYGMTRGTSQSRYPVTEEDRSIARLASTFQTAEEYAHAPAYFDRVADYTGTGVADLETMSDFTPAAMPLLPDMPTRSRKLLEDLGSAPIASQSHRSKYDLSRRHRK